MIQGMPEFLDEFGETSQNVCAVFMKSFSILFVFIGWIDDRGFWQFIHCKTMWFVSLTYCNCRVKGRASKYRKTSFARKMLLNWTNAS